jgi:hypothetical protein
MRWDERILPQTTRLEHVRFFRIMPGNNVAATQALPHASVAAQFASNGLREEKR